MPRHHMTSEGPIPFTPEEEVERDAEEAAWAAGANERLAAEIRRQRDKLLADSDWRANRASEVGGTLDSGWVVYRQSLRDVPQQSGFPTNIDWPVAPGGA